MILPWLLPNSSVITRRDRRQRRMAPPPPPSSQKLAIGVRNIIEADLKDIPGMNFSNYQR